GVFNAEVFARRFQRVAFVRQCESLGPEVKKMTPEFVTLLRFASWRTLRNQVCAVGFVPCSKAFESTLAVNVLDRDAGPVLVILFLAQLVDVGPNPQGESARETTPRILKVVRDPR